MQKQFGRSSEIFKGMMKATFNSNEMVPSDIKDLFRCLLTPSEYDLWEGLWKKALKTVLQEIQQTPDAQDSDHNDITHDHLCGEGDLSSANEQIRLLSKSVLDKICNAAEKTFYQIPSPEIKTSYVNIKQFPSENFLQFVDRLRSQVERQVQDPEEDKVQRMPPWKYLGLQIAARTIVPQKMEIECNPKTLADLHSLCWSLNWAKLSHQKYHQNVPGLIHQFQLTRSQAGAIVATCPSCQVQAMPSMEKAYLTLNPVMNPIQVVILLLLNSLAAAWIIVGKDEARKPYKYDCLDSENEKPVTEIELKSSFTCKSTKDKCLGALAKSAGSDTICLSDTSPDKPFSTCLVGVPFPEGFDNVTFDKYWPYDDHHISPTPSQRHQTYIDNSKVDKSDLQELEILGSLTMSTCYFFHFRGENGPHLNVTPYHPVYSNMTSWCNQTKLLVYDEPHADRFNKLPIRFPKGIWLICGDRAWQGIPSKIDGGPCAMGQLTVIAPSVKKVVKKKSRRIRSSWGHEYESNCDSNFHPWNSGESIAASIFLPQLSSSIALKQLNKLGCWLSKEVNATSTMISDLLTDEEAIRHATLQNRAAIDYLLLAHGHGCEDFEELRWARVLCDGDFFTRGEHIGVPADTRCRRLEGCDGTEHATSYGFFANPHAVHELAEWHKYGDKLWELVLDDDKPAKKMSKFWKIVQNELLKCEAEKQAVVAAKEAQGKNKIYYGHPSDPNPPGVAFVDLPPPPPPPTAPPLPSNADPLSPTPPDPPATEPFPGALSDLAEAMAQGRRETWAALAQQEWQREDPELAAAAQEQIDTCAFPVIFQPNPQGGQRAELVNLDWKLLSQLRATVASYGVTNLKDAFFCLPIHKDSQKFFAFEWENPKSGRKSQLTWTILTQGFKNSPTLFGEQLAKDLESWEAPPEEGKLLQYMDDILIATRTKEACVAWTRPPVDKRGHASLSSAEECSNVSLGSRTPELSAVLEVKGGHWLPPQRFLKYQAIMVEQDDVEIVVTNIINPASFLSGSQGEPVHHDCLETIEASYSSRPDLKDILLDDAETWFTDGSSYVISRKRHAGYAVTTCRKVIESGPLPTDTSAQKAEIIALTRALESVKGKKVNIYTDSRYAFGVVHTHRAIWKERGLLNSPGKNIKHSQEILQLLEAVQLPEQVAIMHIKAHQKVSSELEEGNELADREAKEAAKGEIMIEGALIPDGQVSLEVREEHQKTHWGIDALYNYLIEKITARNLYSTVIQFYLSAKVTKYDSKGSSDQRNKKSS
ncbi:hypothetical protein DUI87_19032 [Hirundo rustica rustica]|uniref:ribonuclease H n=1 Tax=Hirundo rustica rustica TaxID=333673 RepID=A0A3M0JT58_HIRRU|nr:hypothetical protein DUI87_19032 [Hirundo rustica rustica]